MSKEIIEEIKSRKPRKILNKEEFYIMYHAGLLGNKAKSWESYEELIRSGHKNNVCIRSGKGINRVEVRYNVQMEKVEEEIADIIKKGSTKEELRFNEAMPDEYLLIQGELLNTEKGLILYYTKVKKPMNLGLKEKSFHAKGFEAEQILKRSLWSESLGDIEKLLHLYPESVIEFSAYQTRVGHLPKRNTVIWEVRNY